MKIHAQIDHQKRIIPLYDSDADKLRKINRGVDLEIEIKQPRNYKFLKKFFALINMVYENQDIYINIDHLRKDLTIEAGFYEEHADFNGEIIRTAKSISFAKMTEAEFSDLYGKFCDTVIRLMGWDNELIEENIESFL